MMHTKNTEEKDFSWLARAKSFRYAFQGIKTLFKSEHNAWIHLTAAVLVIFCGFELEISATEWCIVVICIGAVTMAEAFNTAIEAIADKVSPEYNPLIGKAKDVAAGGVLLMAIGAAACGLIIFLPKILALI